MYNRPLHDGNWASSIVWGHTRPLQDGEASTAICSNPPLRFRERNYAWTRIENADARTN